MKSKIFSPDIPESKSLVIRRLAIEYLAGVPGKREKSNEGEDVKLARRCFAELKNKKNPKIHTGNSGLLTRILIAICSITNKKIVLEYGEQMHERPIKELIKALRDMGARIEKTKNGLRFFSSKIRGENTIITHSKTSQFLTALLLISPLLHSKSNIIIRGEKNSNTYSEMTIRMMKERGIKTKRVSGGTITIPGNQQYAHRKEKKIESDIASASPHIAIAILNRTKILIKNISENTKQPERKFLSVLKKIGCKLTQKKNGLLIDASETLAIPSHINAKTIPDSALALSILAGTQKTKTRISNTQTWKYKECNRLKTIKNNLKKLGVQVNIRKSTLEIQGSIKRKKFELETFHDHRIAMCSAIIKSKFPGIMIRNPNCVRKSYPNFWKNYKAQILRLNKNFILTGPPGAGKSTLGRALASKYGYRFLDTDELIEKKTKIPIGHCIEKNGWQKFREIEAKIVASLPKKRTIIALGGGGILYERSRKSLSENGYIVSILPSLITTKKRLDTMHPQYKNLKKNYNERKKIYEEYANIVIHDNTNSGDANRDIEKRIARFEQRFFHSTHETRKN